MISFTTFDYLIVSGFFIVVFTIGLLSKYKSQKEGEDYLLGSRKLNLPMFVATTVATWYGGILGVGEFTYKYGILSWITQGLPYYLFALFFAFLLAGKIREAKLYTIPDKIESAYGKKSAVLAALIVFFLVNPAPYLLMTGTLFSILFNFPIWLGMLIAIIVTGIYLLKGGFKSTVYTDIFQFIIMFAGFILIVITLFNNYEGFLFLKQNLPHKMLTIKNANPFFIVVWFLIALWTFVDPGFHQRSYAAKNVRVAKYGIIISVFFWMLFDFLTVTTGLFSRAILGNNINAVISYPLLANKVLSSGAKGLFFAALFATILSTLNSMTFIGATTYSRDFIYRLAYNKGEINIEKNTRIGLLITVLLAFILAFIFQSVVEIWYTVGSILIHGMIMVVLGAYYPKLKIDGKFAFIEMLIGICGSLLWLVLRNIFSENSVLSIVEPMLVGLFLAVVVHLIGMKKRINIP